MSFMPASSERRTAKRVQRDVRVLEFAQEPLEGHDSGPLARRQATRAAATGHLFVAAVVHRQMCERQLSV